MTSLIALVLATSLALAPAAFASAPARLRIKNGHGIMVALGKTREAATGIRPQKAIWTLELDAAVVGAGADAELRDVTPNVAGAVWTVPLQSERLALDAARFVPGHVYRLEVRRARQLVGSALVYLYPPPTERVSRVTLDADPPEPADESDAPATTPKGGL